MYAQRYGTIPVVHATGGLKDSVMQYNPFDTSAEGVGTGWWCMFIYHIIIMCFPPLTCSVFFLFIFFDVASRGDACTYTILLSCVSPFNLKRFFCVFFNVGWRRLRIRYYDHCFSFVEKQRIRISTLVWRRWQMHSYMCVYVCVCITCIPRCVCMYHMCVCITCICILVCVCIRVCVCMYHMHT